MTALLDEHGQPKNLFFNHDKIINRGIDELIGICRGAIADGCVVFKEAEFIVKWMENNKLIANQWPANIIYPRIKKMLLDNTLDREEQIELLELLTRIVGGEIIEDQQEVHSTTLPLDQNHPKLIYPAHTFCFTGKFIYGTRSKCQNEVIQRGGLINPSNSLTKNTNYLIIGTVGSRDWLHSSFGLKIKEAIKLKKSGSNLYIIAEKDWIVSLECI
jgi:NAD-dependent DNA ligase